MVKGYRLKNLFLKMSYHELEKEYVCQDVKLNACMYWIHG